jgi:hypothetical protein
MSKQSVIEKKLAKKGFEENSEPLKVIKVSRRELKSLKNE